MKKIIALLLVLVCMFSFVACNDKENPDEPDTDKEQQTDDLKAFNDAIANTAPKTATVKTTLEVTALGETLNGKYNVVYNEDGSAKVTYEVEELAKIDASTTDPKKTVTGEVTIAKDGKVSGTISPSVTAVAGVKLTLDAEKMTFSVDKNVLTANVKAADTAAVLGVELPADAVITLAIAENAVTTYTISYKTAEGPATITCVF